MNTVKTHTLITRGVSKDARNWLKRIAKEKRTSVNSIVLNSIDFYRASDAAKFDEMIKKSMNITTP